MTAARKPAPARSFAERILSEGGVGVEAAVEAAEARLETIREDAADGIRQMLAQMEAVRGAVLAGDADAYAFLRKQSDGLVGVAAVFGMAEVGAAALSLRKLFDACAPGLPRPRAVCVHLDALRMFRAADPVALSLRAPMLLRGLDQVVAAAASPSAASSGPRAGDA